MSHPADNVFRRFLSRIQLNGNVLGLILRNRWLTPGDIGRSYDQISPQYNANWLAHLEKVTDQLMSDLPQEASSIADLGCGTGYTTAVLASKYPGAYITGIDISQGMLDKAVERTGPSVHYCHDDMLQWLKRQKCSSHDLIISAWSMGYSNPNRVTKEASRVLKNNGYFLFVVNFRDTLSPIFKVFRQCMRTFPKHVHRIVLPRFPASEKKLLQSMINSGLRVRFSKEGKHVIRQSLPEQAILPWLLNTGVLAGFDKVIPLHEEKTIQLFFEENLRRQWSPLTHHYVMATGQKV